MFKNTTEQNLIKNELKENIDQAYHKKNEMNNLKNNYKNHNSQIKMMFGSDFESQKASPDFN